MFYISVKGRNPMDPVNDPPPSDATAAEALAAMSLQERAATWPEVVRAQQRLALALQDIVHQQREVLAILARLGAPTIEQRGRSLVETLIQATQTALELEELELDESAAVTRAVRAAVAAVPHLDE